MGEFSWATLGDVQDEGLEAFFTLCLESVGEQFKSSHE